MLLLGLVVPIVRLLTNCVTVEALRSRALPYVSFIAAEAAFRQLMAQRRGLRQLHR